MDLLSWGYGMEINSNGSFIEYSNLFGLKVYCFETNSCVYEDGRCDHDDDNYEHGGPDRVWISCPTGSVSVHFAALRMIIFIIMILCMGA